MVPWDNLVNVSAVEKLGPFWRIAGRRTHRYVSKFASWRCVTVVAVVVWHIGDWPCAPVSPTIFLLQMHLNHLKEPLPCCHVFLVHYLIGVHGKLSSTIVKSVSLFVRHAHVQLRKTEPAPLECSQLPFPVSHVRLSLLANAVVPQLVRNCCTGNLLCCSGMSLLSFWLLWLLLLLLIGHNSSWACWWKPSRWLVDIS